MPIPPNTYVFEYEMDPKDLVDFTIEGSSFDKPILEPGETIASFTLTLGAESAALGMELGSGSYLATVTNDETGVKFWSEFYSGFYEHASFTDPGVTLPLELYITTSSTPPRKYQRTVAIKVTQQ